MKSTLLRPIRPPTLPSGIIFLPSAGLGVTTAVLGTLAARRTAPDVS